MVRAAPASMLSCCVAPVAYVVLVSTVTAPTIRVFVTASVAPAPTTGSRLATLRFVTVNDAPGASVSTPSTRTP